MIRFRRLVAVGVFATSLVAVPIRPASAVPVHPHLLFDSTDVAGLQARVGVAGTEPQKAYDLLRKKADYYKALSPTPAADGYYAATTDMNQNKMGTVLADLGFAYQLTGDTSYADKAIEYMRGLAGAGWPFWQDTQLGAGDLAKGAALAFDWTYDRMAAYDTAHGYTGSNATIPTIVNSLIAEFPTLGNNAPESLKLFGCLDPDWNNTVLAAAGEPPNAKMNWGGVCSGGEGLLLLAIKDETCCTFPPGGQVNTMLAEAYNKVKNYIGNTYGDGSGTATGGTPDNTRSGDYTEGLTYAAYGGKNSLPFAFAWTHMGLNSTTIPGSGSDPLAEPGTEGLDEFPIHLAFEQEPETPSFGGTFGPTGNHFIPRNDSNDKNWFMLETLPYFFKVRPDGVTGWIWDHSIGSSGEDYFGHLPTTYSEASEDANWGEMPRHRSSEMATILYYKTPTEIARTDPSTVAGKARWYSDYGLVDMRTGFANGADEVAVTFEAKRNHDVSKGHSQLDVGSFTLYGYGARLATDSGYGHDYGCVAPGPPSGCGYPPEPNMTTAGKAIGHNVMLVADTLQGTETQQSAHIYTTNPTVTGFVDGANLTYLSSNLGNAYDPSAPPRAIRSLIFSRRSQEPVFLAVTDGLQRNSLSHLYEWRLNTYYDGLDSGDDNTTSTSNNQFTITAPNGVTLNGAVTALNPRSVVSQMSNTGSTGTGPQGSLALRSTDASSLPRLSIEHLAVMAPTPVGTGITAPVIASVTTLSGNLIKATWGTNSRWTTGTAWFSSRGPAVATVSSGDFSSNAAFAKVSDQKGETVMESGTLVQAGSGSSLHKYVEITRPPLGGSPVAATVVVSGDTITVTGSTATNIYSIWTPATQTISHVYINGTAISMGSVTHNTTTNIWQFQH